MHRDYTSQSSGEEWGREMGLRNFLPQSLDGLHPSS